MKKLAIIVTHPIQYYAPIFRLLQGRGKITLRVFYTWSQSREGAKFDPGFGKEIKWDLPLLEGYDHVFVKNISSNPGTHHFRGIINPTLNKEVKDWGPDMLLVFGWSFHSHLKCLRYFHKKIPVLFRGDSTLLAEKFGLKKLIRTIFLKWVYKHVDYALYVGTNNKSYYLRHGLKPGQLIFAPHAIDNSRFFDTDGRYTREAEKWRQHLGISKDDIVILYAGKLESKKNSQLLIKAFKELHEPGCHLIILGNGPIEKELKSKYSATPNLHFIDFQNQLKMPIVYHLCDVFTLPSKGPIETWGLSINEAMACAKPVLVSDVCGATVDLVKDGVNGFAFKSDNKKELVNKMRYIVNNKEVLGNMGENSLKIIKEWTFERICDAIEQIVNREHSSQNDV